MKHYQQLGEGIALLRYPLPAFGLDFGRNVTLLRLCDGRVIIHSTAPFNPDDVATIRAFGQPGWLVDATPSPKPLRRSFQISHTLLPLVFPSSA